jgi:hypothetical protein
MPSRSVALPCHHDLAFMHVFEHARIMDNSGKMPGSLELQEPLFISLPHGTTLVH